MRKLLFITIVMVSLFGCKEKQKEEDRDNNPENAGIETPAVKIDSTLITDTSWGPITRNMNYGDLQAAYGSANVTNERICGAECADSVDVTIINAQKPSQITVYWKDSAYHKKIAFLECFDDNAPYHTSDSIKAGSTLADLVRVNGQKITFWGFSWDYGGTIISFNKGKFENSPINYRIMLSGDYNVSDGLDGEIELTTDMAKVKKALDRIKIYYLSLSFAD